MKAVDLDSVTHVVALGDPARPTGSLDGMGGVTRAVDGIRESTTPIDREE